MAPTPAAVIVEESTKKMRPQPGEEVVISGMSGIFPKSDSVMQFGENLYNKVDMVTTENPRWVYNHPEVPKHLGQVNGMGKFDAQFFRVHYKQAATMEPMSRKLLEHAYSAIYDSGINPLQLRGQKVGVFIGSTFSESEKIVIYENIQRNGFGITGCNKAMYANRISYWIDGKGPSYSLDLACASSTACIEHAYRSISSGQCDAAIVGGCNLCMHPNVSLHIRRAGLLCLDGKTRCFDKNGEGYVRSDAISVLFLQRAKDAKRIYTEVYHAKANYSPRSELLVPNRQPKEIIEFLEAFYAEVDVSPEDVEYIEANGAALVEADTNELQAIGAVFAKNRSVKIGCVKSNMGSSEPASGVCGITKACLAYHSGKLPGNLHYENPLDVSEIKNRKLEVLTDNSTFDRGFAALNTFSYSGANVHVLFKGHYKPKVLSLYKSNIPHLVLVSGRQDNCVENILKTIKKNSIDPEQIGLIHNIHKNDIPGHMSRGYTILDTNEQYETVSQAQSIEYYDGNPRPVWFVYSGMGSQWAGMGAELMRIPTFAAAIQKCHKVLEPKGIDIVRILTDPDKTIYDNILHSFVGIAAVQIGLTDILNELGIVPNNIIGHSVGELGCAYADGCFTAEEMILAAYCRGLVSIQTPFIRGSMAAVGLGYKAILPMCPPEIEVACHNSEDSATISGPADTMKQFVAELTSQGIFAKEVPCSNIAYHSRYIADAGPELLKHLNEVIKVPKLRSKKWISTSVPNNKWKDPVAQYSSAEYHTNNLLNSVLFEESSKFIPNGALVIEIAPHGLLQAILKRSLAECIHVPMTRRGAPDPVKFFLESIGKLYQAGLNPKVDILYPKIEYPVSTETPMLSHYVEWEHNEDWAQAKFKDSKDRIVATNRDFVMSFHDDDYNYFKGYIRDGNYIFPEAAFLLITWETFAMYKGVNYRDLSVTFRDVTFHSEIIINPEIPVRLEIMIYKGHTKFEISYENAPIVTGFITEKTNENNHRDLYQHIEKDGVTFSFDDIYTTLRLRGYTYKDEFQSIYSSNSNQTIASLKWDTNWITFLDSVMQFNAFARNYDGMSKPSLIKSLSIDVQKHLNCDKMKIGDITCIYAEIFQIYEYTRCGGVEVQGLIFKDVPIVEQKPDILLDKKFVSHFVPELTDIKTVIQINLQIVADNINDKKITAFISSGDFASHVQDVASTTPYVEFDFKSEADENIKLVVTENLLGDKKEIVSAYQALPNNAFLLTLENDATKIELKNEMFSVITIMNIQNQAVVLLKKLYDQQNINITYLPIVEDRNFSWISRLQVELTRSNKVVLVSERQPIGGLFGMVKKLREEYGDKIGLVLVDDYTVPSFNPENDIYKEQLEKGLSINIFVKGHWGGYYYISNPTTLNVQNVQLTTTLSDLDGLSWVEQTAVPATNMQVQVCYTGPSFKDAQDAFSKTNNNKALGMDFSGITKSGQKVMGLISGGAIANTIEADPDLLWPVPEHWSLEDAATVPLPFVHAYYCLAIRCQLTRGSIIFINGGAAALGQAIISLCLALDCTVYTSVSDLKKKEFLLKMFPELDEKKILPFSDALFQDAIRASSKGCALVINCASREFRKSAIKCLGECSLFLDLNEYDMKSNDEFGMSFLQLSRNYSTALLCNIFRPEFSADKKLLQKMISDGIARDIVRPLTRIIYSPANVTKAFRLLSSSKDTGRVLIKMRNFESFGKDLAVYSRITYSSKGTYVVVCDETAVGMELADRLVKHGARKLLINIKPNSIAGYCYTKFLSWSKCNVGVKISSENLQTEKSCVALLQEGSKLGPIMGIFIVQNSNSTQSFDSENVAIKFNNTACVVANLDMASRNFCNELNHFTVFNHSKGDVTDEYMLSVTDKICQARNDISLPALVYRAGLLKEIDIIESANTKMQHQSIYTAFDALETSLKLKYNNVISYNLKKDAASMFIKKIEKIIGVNDINELDEKLSLKNFLINETVIDEVNEAIKDAYRISYPPDKIQAMTIESLKKLSQEVSKSNHAFHTGLGAFFKYIDQDECAAAEPIVTMATSFSKVKEEDELDPKETYLLLIPGFGGHHEVFTPITERLKVQAMAFQYSPELTNADIPEMAAYILKFMKKRLELKSKFYLLGYSFGVNIALELAALIEKEGHVGVVYCLDSSPDALRVQLDAYVGHLTDSELQNRLVQHMYKLMSGCDSEDLIKELERKDSWNEKIELCVNKLRGLVKYSHQYKRCILEGTYKRIMLARNYEPTFKLQSELVLIKGIPHPNSEKLTNDYNLSKYTTKPVKIFDIESDHPSAVQDCRVANIVNSLLEPKLLEAYKNKNLLWTYLRVPIKSW